jgi:hypothetical protein
LNKAVAESRHLQIRGPEPPTTEPASTPEVPTSATEEIHIPIDPSDAEEYELQSSEAEAFDDAPEEFDHAKFFDTPEPDSRQKPQRSPRPQSQSQSPASTEAIQTMVDRGYRGGVFVSLSEDIVRRYQSQAAAAGVDLPSFLAARLSRCVDHVSARGLWIDDMAIRDLAPILNSALMDTRSLVGAVKGLVQVRVKGHSGVDEIESPVEFYIDRELANRIAMGARSGVTFEQVLIQSSIWGIKTRGC